MDPEELDRKVDEWLDSALSQYSDAEPRTGLEQRILANVRAEERAPRRRRWLLWTPALAAAAAIIIVAVAIRPIYRSSAPEGTTPVAQAPASASAETPQTNLKVEKQQQRKPADAARRLELDEPRRSRGKEFARADDAKVALAEKQVAGEGNRRDLAALEVHTRKSDTRLKAERKESAGGIGGGVVGPVPPQPSAPAFATVSPENDEFKVNAQRPESPRKASGGVLSKDSAHPGTVVQSLSEVVTTTAAAESMAAAPSASGRSFQQVLRMAPVERPAVFPTPVPLSRQEVLLFHAIQQARKARGPSRLPPGDEPLAPVQIEEIRIKPLEDSEK